MDIIKLMESRHSVRQYVEKEIEENVREELNQCIKECNAESGLHIQAIFDEPKCFDTMMAHYGSFTGVSNYIAMVGEKSDKLEELCGYYGEKIVLKAQELGLNTCWVALTYGKGKCASVVSKGEKQVCVIALGYGTNHGVPHKSKELSALSEITENVPDWYALGMKAAMLAPTAVNQQKFYFCMDGEKAVATAGKGFYAKLDLGIVKYHFEIASGHSVEIK